MLASLADPPLTDPAMVYEPKYDGIRAIVEVSPDGRVHLWSRLGNEKTAQFPEIAGALGAWAKARKVAAVLDGELVALDAKGEPAGFQRLQGRIHLTEGEAAPARVAFIAFDLLRDGGTDLRDLRLTDRRARLERLFKSARSQMLRISEQVRGDGNALYARALASGWEGLIVKHADSRYRSGKRTPDWRKLKIVNEQEFVIGGWTEPRHTRTYFGALLLGVNDGGSDAASPAIADADHERTRPTKAFKRGAGAPHQLKYVGHVGTGFKEPELARLMKLLRPLEIKECPFRERPPSNEKPHWVAPQLVVQVKFTEWTDDGKLRHPVYLGLRDDKKAADVTREQKKRLHKPTPARGSTAQAGSRGDRSEKPGTSQDSDAVVSQLLALEEARRDGTIDLPDGKQLAVTNLHKLFWPKQKITKGELLRYYATVAHLIRPAVADRPLVMKRYPNGVTAKPFYQHRAPEVPPGIRSEVVAAAEKRAQLIGGDLITLLYMTQLAAISQDPWFSRVQSPTFVDHVALDLDPMPGVSFDRVLEVARWIRDELATIGVTGFPKTSGADGLHVYIPMPRETPYEAGLLFSQIVATMVANKHPKHATVERSVRGRGQRVYVDYLQNILGKTLATAYSARSSDYAGVSTPLTWEEVDAGVSREDFSVRTAPARFAKLGDLWADLRKSKGVDLARAAKFARRR